MLGLFFPIALMVGVLFWLSLAWMIGRFGAWYPLAQHYTTSREPAGDAFRWSSVRFGLFSNYSNSVNITVSFEGIYLRPIYFFRMGHPPLLIPWEAVAAIEQMAGGIVPTTRIEIQPLVGGKPSRMTLYGKKLGDCVRRNAPKRLNHGDEFA
jgi:hypothetical protein